MILTNSSLVEFFNGQIGFALEGRAYRGWINGGDHISVAGEDNGIKTLSVRPLMIAKGNRAPEQKKQMWMKNFEFSALEFYYYDADVLREDGAVIITDQKDIKVTLYPPGHPDCLDMKEVINPSTEKEAVG